ncbi:hypothetical protein E0W68_10405 [Flavobacterium salilacus subsp. salilacus]|uniref:hypothetical protein n=1 Tax=Flavobacterium TaxID=237 RepID=UPI00107501E6|nr:MULTISPECIES: hypothetical protein [Flavobacterium]KAF2518141.1 hypothetical protein E0W68_10405 [Flavobacterium salilacus subsp. salilacus]MBE1615549.1 hypothetical protein [Flavobacterium sp. SaA2.13]
MEDIYKIIVSEDKLNERFKLLTENALFDPAKNIIKNICDLIDDKDGNFIKDFQSTGFDARLWEIYLFIFLYENLFELINDFNRPDFHVKKKEYDFFIKASLSSEKNDDKYSEQYIKKAVEKNDLVIQKKLTDYYSIRLGSVLFSKLNKKYWELDWVKGKPIVLAITPSHNYIAKFLPDAKIMEYLYGVNIISKEIGGELIHIKNEVVEEHTHGEKTIPSNFFSHPNTENISAIIFSNNCDLHKFNRMGYEHKLSEKNLIMIRSGYKYDDSKPNAKAKDFTYQVEKGKSTENWNESLTIFHNPNAKIPLDKDLFHNVRQLWVNDKGEFDGIMMKHFVYNSITGVSEILDR